MSNDKIQIVPGKTLDRTKPVHVYRNLNKPGVVWSVRQKGIVVAYATLITLKDCKFVVKENQRQRVILRKCREVHAWIEGTVADFDLVGGPKLSYNPYKAGYYYDVQTNGEVKTAKALTFGVEGVFYHQILPSTWTK